MDNYWSNFVHVSQIKPYPVILMSFCPSNTESLIAAIQHSPSHPFLIWTCECCRLLNCRKSGNQASTVSWKEKTICMYGSRQVKMCLRTCAKCADSDWMRRLIWAFTARIYPETRFWMALPNWSYFLLFFSENRCGILCKSSPFGDDFHFQKI